MILIFNLPLFVREGVLIEPRWNATNVEWEKEPPDGKSIDRAETASPIPALNFTIFFLIGHPWIYYKRRGKARVASCPLFFLSIQRSNTGEKDRVFPSFDSVSFLFFSPPPKIIT